MPLHRSTGKWVALLVIVLIICSTPIALADFRQLEWKFSRLITGEPFDGYSKVELDEIVYDKCNDSFDDLRIIDSTGKEVPFKLVEEAGKSDVVQENEIDPYNLSVFPGSTNFYLDAGEGAAFHNRITINTDDADFVGRVKIEGSYDERKWHTLTDNGFIYDMNESDEPVSNTTISYSDSDYRYLRLTIANDSDYRISVNSVSIANITQTLPKERMVAEIKASLTPAADRSQAIADIEYRQPSNRIEVLCEDVNFYRQVIICGSENRRDWIELGEGAIYKFDTPTYKASQTSVAYPQGSYRFLRLEILNADDQPLSVSSIRIYDYERFLFFSGKNRPLHLYYGNSRAQASSYDIEKVFPYLDKGSARLMKLGPEMKNNAFVEQGKPWIEENPLFLWVILAAAGGLLVLLSLNLIRQISSNGK